jgi:cytochrome c oxidase accessory protein FixG
MKEPELSDTFRERPLTLDAEGNRKWIHARQPKGKWYTRRTIVGFSFMLFLIIAPFLRVHGHPFMQLDVLSFKFYVFGAIIGSHDTFVLALIMAIAVVSIILITAVWGRIFCGWACPQTIFLEMVYRRIEYLFEGNNRGSKMIEDKALIRIKRIGKHLAFFIVSVFFTNVFLSWFIGPYEVLKLASEPIGDHIIGFSVMLVLSLFYYGIYSFLREQVCTLFCPYGRLQGVLLDSKSTTVIYDYNRGEPRGAKNAGDCIDCGSCIAVCPTGIDIKNGNQLECINCTACIDECNTVMHKIKKPKDLIRYDSAYGIVNGKRSVFNARTVAYSSVLLLLLTVLIVTLANQTETSSILLRVTGTLYQKPSPTELSNMYELKMVNKSSQTKQLTLELLEPQKGRILVMSRPVVIKPNGEFSSIVQVILPLSVVHSAETKITMQVKEGAEVIEKIDANFIGPYSVGK